MTRNKKCIIGCLWYHYYIFRHFQPEMLRDTTEAPHEQDPNYFNNNSNHLSEDFNPNNRNNSPQYVHNIPHPPGEMPHQLLMAQYPILHLPAAVPQHLGKIQFSISIFIMWGQLMFQELFTTYLIFFSKMLIVQFY